MDLIDIGMFVKNSQKLQICEKFIERKKKKKYLDTQFDHNLIVFDRYYY